ncbi:uncharacterized protein CMU_030110 [Cryptosporidium muris RN66]|uniref:Cyclin-like domain-containing protein n=1 Tax=Cryptosporidium muris (strain RN66) TaxID=441375 RepID=B6AI94_CRYMR|nr:uncharacterized protein CMU_030110 [Cryptosporidium muris RN66]EEA07935.1 hypothetical protein CMU_030110 [Cryptosporidium muris RN66]|eukprot:XP_002142284.1 hypothetical protein [Cryptosporidium muris RN66]
MTFPSESHYLSDWIFESELDIKKIRLQINNRVKNEWIEYLKISNSTKDPQNLMLSLEDEELLVLYYGRQLMEFTNHKKLPFVVKYSAALLYQRFYIYQSVMSYDPRIIIFTCISLAIKLEEFGLHFTLEQLFGDVPGLNILQIFQHELIVCNTLKFHLYLINPRNPLEALKILYKRYYIETIIDNEKQKELSIILNKVIAKVELYVLTASQTLCFLIYSPSQVALALFDICGRELNLPNVKDFINNTIREIHQSIIISKYSESVVSINKNLEAIHRIKEIIYKELQNEKKRQQSEQDTDEIIAANILDKLVKLQKKKNKEQKKRKREINT